MANTVTIESQFIEIIGLDTDWDYTELGFHYPPEVTAIRFDPGAANDLMIVHSESATGIQCFRAYAFNVHDQKCQYYNGERIKLYLKISECTCSSGARLLIEFQQKL